MFSLLLAIGFLGLLYKYLTWNFDYWRKRNVFGPTPLPFFGNYPKSAVLCKNIMYEQEELYRKYKDKHRYIGVFERRTPKLLILDETLVSDIYVKHFKHFEINDSSSSFDEKLDPIFSRNIFASQGDYWRNTRKELSPAFTQAKLQPMYSIIHESAVKMLQFIDSHVGTDKSKTINTKDLTSRLTADISISAIYGLQSDAFEVNAELHRNLVEWFSPSLVTNIANAVLSTFPFFASIYRPSFFPPQLTKWFYDVMNEACMYRQSSELKRNDFLQFLLDRKAIEHHSNARVAEFAAIFFFDAFETTSMILAQALYYLAKNEACQQKLRREIIQLFSSDEQQCPTASSLSAANYLDNVVNETLRISPSAFLLAKNCTEPIEFSDMDGTKLIVERGTSIQLPVYAIHHDPRFFDNPNCFQPERFDGVSLNNLKKSGRFIPFGDGQRICLGQKFAIIQIKLALIEIIRSYALTVKTPKNVTATALDALLTPISEIYLDFHRL